MTKYQKFVFEHPCLAEQDCARDDYRRVHPPWSAILTLNIGLSDPPTFEGLPIWHCSVALISEDGAPVRLEIWDNEVLKKCEQFIRDELLDGVGDPGCEATEIGVCALHVRRRCSEQEINELSVRGVWPRLRDRARWN